MPYDAVADLVVVIKHEDLPSLRRNVGHRLLNYVVLYLNEDKPFHWGGQANLFQIMPYKQLAGVRNFAGQQIQFAGRCDQGIP